MSELFKTLRTIAFLCNYNLDLTAATLPGSIRFRSTNSILFHYTGDVGNVDQAQYSRKGKHWVKTFELDSLSCIELSARPFHSLQNRRPLNARKLCLTSISTHLFVLLCLPHCNDTAVSYPCYYRKREVKGRVQVLTSKEEGEGESGSYVC